MPQGGFPEALIAGAVNTRVPVAVGAVLNSRGEVLVSRRPQQVHQGGLWEFPGGKIEPSEDGPAALGRELREELGIEVVRAQPLITVAHEYAERAVVLHVWKVLDFRGVAQGREGQPLRWVSPERLDRTQFPAANVPIINALRLPAAYLITPEPAVDHDAFLAALDQALAGGIRLFQLRAHALDEAAYLALAGRVVERARRWGAALLLNCDPDRVALVGAAGVHLSSARLRRARARPLGPGYWVGASCHDAAELAQARRIGADFAVLSPVLPTPGHPHARPLGWGEFAELVATASLPVFALGGLGRTDLGRAQRVGAQGIAAMRSLWAGSLGASCAAGTVE